jgi:RNA polymerase sigma-70 factor (ECF subfamily)
MEQSLHISSYSDEQLAHEVWKKSPLEESAFKEIYKRHSQGVYAYCSKVLGYRHGERIQDIFQEIFMKFHAQLKKIEHLENLEAYLFRIARNSCLNEKKRFKPDTVDIAELSDIIGSKSDDMDKQELLLLIRTAVNVLSDEYKEIFVLREYNGCSYKEISTILNIPETTVKVRLHRAKKKIESILEPYIQELG